MLKTNQHTLTNQTKILVINIVKTFKGKVIPLQAWCGPEGG